MDAKGGQVLGAHASFLALQRKLLFNSLVSKWVLCCLRSRVFCLFVCLVLVFNFPRLSVFYSVTLKLGLHHSFIRGPASDQLPVLICMVDLAVFYCSLQKHQDTS